MCYAFTTLVVALSVRLGTVLVHQEVKSSIPSVYTAKREAGEELPAISIRKCRLDDPADTSGVSLRPEKGYCFCITFGGHDLRFLPLYPGEACIGSTREELDTIITASRCPNYLNELPRHRWAIRDTLWISETEVGNGHFGFFAVAVLGDSSYLSADPLLPVVNVTWYEADAFCAWLTVQVEGIRLRLPHEVEWEYAARGSSNNPYPWGRQAIFDSLANFGGAIGRPCHISSYPSGKSPWGVLNLAGNVYEWCANRPYSYPTDSTTIASDDTPSEEGERDLRGGSFLNGPYECRAAARYFLPPSARRAHVGFRVLLEKSLSKE